MRAGHWLARHQDADGCWRRFEHHGVPHTYNTRGTWALLATALIAGDTRLEGGRRPQPGVGADAAAAVGMVRQQRVHAGPGAVHAHDRLRDSRIPRMRRAARRASATSVPRSRPRVPWRTCSAPMAGSPEPTARTGLRARALLLSHRRGADEPQLDAPRAGGGRNRVARAMRAGRSPSSRPTSGSTIPTRSSVARSRARRRSGAVTRCSSFPTGPRSSSPTP